MFCSGSTSGTSGMIPGSCFLGSPSTASPFHFGVSLAYSQLSVALRCALWDLGGSLEECSRARKRHIPNHPPAINWGVDCD